MADFLTLTDTERLQAFILLRTQQLRSAKKQLKMLAAEASSSSSFPVAPSASELPLPPFNFAAPHADPEAWLEMVPSVVLEAGQAAEEHVDLEAAHPPPAAEEHVVIEVSPAPSEAADDASESSKPKKRSGPHRKMKILGNLLKNETPIFIESLGDRWDGVFSFTESGPIFRFLGTDYASPAAVSKAHAARITEAHPKTTKPGNGWDYIVITETGKTIGELYDSANAV